MTHSRDALRRTAGERAIICEGLEPRRLFAGPAVTSFTLIDADADRALAALADGAVLDLSKLPSRHLNVRADVGPGGAGSVRFGYDANPSYPVENGAPYALASNSGADYFAWTPAVGAHTLSATAFTLSKAGGVAGATRTVRFTVTNGTTPAPATPSPTPAPAPTPPPSASTGSFTITAAQVGTTGVKLTWPAQAGAAKYRVTYTPGAYIPGSAGAPHTVVVSGPSLSLSGRASFTMYSVDVTALDSAGAAKAAAHVNAWTAAPATLKRYLYAFDLPKERKGFTHLKPQIEVFDVANGHNWVKNIPLPSGIYNVRGVAASIATGRMYLTFFDKFQDGYQPGGLLCIDMVTNKVLWTRHYAALEVPSPDRFALTPDGSKIYMPVGEYGQDDFWVVIDARTGNPLRRIRHVTAPHNTNMSVDGRYAFLEGQEKGTENPAWRHTVAVVDTATDTVVQRVGPFRDVVRPYVVNGKASLIFATVNNFVGFQVGDVRTGKILYTVAPPGYQQPDPSLNVAHSHGVALTPDERELWVVDTDRAGFHVWDVSKVPSGGAPRYITFVQVRRSGKNLAGQIDPAASNDTNGVPAWIVSSYDGKYMYAEGGEIIDVKTHKVIGQLRPKTTDSSGKTVWAPYTHSRFMLEVDFDGGKSVHVTDQFGIGRVR